MLALPVSARPLEPERKTVTIQGADQKDINFTVKSDNASAETVYASNRRQADRRQWR